VASSRRAIAERRARFRDAKRSARDLDALILARELDKLSARFPRFSFSINSLSYRVRFQLRSPQEKQKLIRRALASFERLALEEIRDETGLDATAVVESLAPMVRAKEIGLCLRDGTPYVPPVGARLDALGRQLDSLKRVAPTVPGEHGRLAVYFRLTPRED